MKNKDRMMESETSHSTTRAYRVEVRATKAPLVNTEHQYIGHEWVDMPTVKVKQGIVTDDKDALTRSYNYYAAIAMAATFLANLDWRLTGIEVRIVEYKRSIDYKMTEVKTMPFPNEIDEIFARAGYADRVEETADK